MEVKSEESEPSKFKTKEKHTRISGAYWSSQAVREPHLHRITIV